MFNFSDLLLEQLTLELRFENAFLYIDKCGSILRDIFAKYPSATAESVAVNETKIVLPDTQISLAFSPARIVLNQQYPSGISDIGEFGDFAIDRICKTLEISAYTRVGNRFIYILKIDDEKESLELMKNTGFFNIPQEKVSQMGDTLKSANIKFQITRDDEVGYGISLGHVNRTLNLLQLPKPIKYDASKFILSGLAVDVDFYTMKPVDSGNVKAHELIKKNIKDMESLISGLLK
ncbi:MAG: hypothetical protein HZA15_07800 [Nitrospirae bacterium]|nr:hypothetical protein [Nitrospirota bacterium]